MAKLEKNLTGNFNDLLNIIESGISKITYSDGTVITVDYNKEEYTVN